LPRWFLTQRHGGFGHGIGHPTDSCPRDPRILDDPTDRSAPKFVLVEFPQEDGHSLRESLSIDARKSLLGFGELTHFLRCCPWRKLVVAHK
jgi:hypothetical protein